MTQHFRKELILNISLLAGTFAVLTAGLVWMQRDINGHNAAIVENRTLIYRQSHAAEALAQLKQDAPLAARYEKLLGNLLPTQDQLLEFRKFVDSIGHLRRLGTVFQFQSIQVQPQLAAAGHAPFVLEATGDYADIAAFLKEIEVKNSRFIVDIGNVSIESVGNGAYKLSARGRVFFMEETKAK
jgi:Tfp pilus assembly protein PilO